MVTAEVKQHPLSCVRFLHPPVFTLYFLLQFEFHMKSTDQCILLYKIRKRITMT